MRRVWYTVLRWFGFVHVVWNPSQNPSHDIQIGSASHIDLFKPFLKIQERSEHFTIRVAPLSTANILQPWLRHLFKWVCLKIRYTGIPQVWALYNEENDASPSFFFLGGSPLFPKFSDNPNRGLAASSQKMSGVSRISVCKFTSHLATQRTLLQRSVNDTHGQQIRVRMNTPQASASEARPFAWRAHAPAAAAFLSSFALCLA